ncbi:MAG: hypothetical protein ACK43K_13795, partial [Chitinophagales bacterium]
YFIGNLFCHNYYRFPIIYFLRMFVGQKINLGNDALLRKNFMQFIHLSVITDKNFVQLSVSSV